MSNQLIVNVTSFETRIALLENTLVSELFIERVIERGLTGNIYIGKVQRVLPGMQAAFIELGLDKAAFLYAGDVLPPDLPDEGFSGQEETAPLPANPKRQRTKLKIENLLKAGQFLLVQVTKDSIGTKGPRVSCNISLPGRHIVFMPAYDHIGISRRITQEEERVRLRGILLDQKPKGGGFVARTVSLGVSESKLKEDCEFLKSLWDDIRKRSREFSVPTLVQPELDLILRCTRDMTNEHLDRIVIDNAEAYQRTHHFLALLDTKLLEKLEHYTGVEPIFERYSIENEITRAMSRKVWLRSGGYLVIDQAEALTAIDVNTGRFVGKQTLEDTILKTNLEAVKETAYQLRLRNIGGMVIIDFIDMESQVDRDKVLHALMEAVKKDKARCNVIKISELGLVEMTRQRNRDSLEHQLCEPCFYCDGKGALKSKQTIAYEIFRTLLESAKSFSEPVVMVHAHPEVVDLILAEERKSLEEIEFSSEKKILIRPRGSFHQEQFDIFGTSNPNKKEL